MCEFQHSIVLFSGDDGLPLEFNVRNTNEKALLKSLIEYGGGLCTQSDNAVHLISPGTKVLNAVLGKKLVSSRYIFDCVKENYLLDVNDYVFTISEAETSDISDEESEKLKTNRPFVMNVARFKTSLNCNEEPIELDLVVDDAGPAFPNVDSKTDFTHPPSSPLQPKNGPNTSTASSSESFIESSMKFHFNPVSLRVGHEDEPLTSTAKEPNTVNIDDNFNQLENDCSPIRDSASLVPPEILPLNNGNGENNFKLALSPVLEKCPGRPSPIQTVVSSSQQAMDDLDQFDNLLLNKIQQKPQLDDEEHLSQSYTVSSSADAQVASKPVSVGGNSAEIFAFGQPDSPTLGSNLMHNRHLYVQQLESEIENILLKPSPKSLQDKISLVKYICCVKKLPPSVVLASLQNL